MGTSRQNSDLRAVLPTKFVYINIRVPAERSNTDPWSHLGVLDMRFALASKPWGRD